MFRKLVSNLPFSPSLINQLGFYTNRLKKEQFTRKLGFIFMILAILTQTMTVAMPTQASVKASDNDIVYGGNGKTKAGIVQAYANNRDNFGHTDIRAIFNYYHITAANLNSSKVVEIRSTTANNYMSIGREKRGYGVESKIPVPVVSPIYSRGLHEWPGASGKRWQALEIQTDQGVRWILLECGNIVTGGPTPEKPKNPNLKLEKSVDKPNAKKGEKVTFKIKVTNIGNGVATNAYVYDDAPVGMDLVNDGLDAKHHIKSPRRWETPRFNLAPGQSFTYALKAVITRWGPVTLINRACVDFFDVNIYDNCDTATVTVPNGCPIPGKEELPKDDPSCKTNPNLVITKTADKKNLKLGDTFEYTLKVTNKGDVNLPKAVVRDLAPEQLEFLEVKEVGSTVFKKVTNPRDYVSTLFPIKKGATVTIVLKAKVIKNSSEAVKNTACVLSTGAETTAGGCDDETIVIKETCPTNPTLPKDDTKCQQPCPIEGKQNLPAGDPGCKPCEESKQSQDGKDLSCLELHKKARNITQQIENANGTKANAGDTIEYTLSVTNKSKETRNAFVVEEAIGDVMEYADVIDASGATYATNPVKMLTWKPVDIKPNETINRTVLVKIKSTIPTTPASTSDSSSYDMKMFNVYGDSVTIDLPQNPVKVAEQTITSLPSTGLGANVVISTILIMVVTYFYFRSRTMVKELGLVRQQFNYGAGL